MSAPTPCCTVESPLTHNAWAPRATSDEIARRAYEISLERNGRPGDALSDWLQAEQELNGGR